MMRLIIGSSLRFRYLVLALGVVLTWFGLARLRDVPVDVFPEFAPPRVEIQTICLGLSSAEVEQLVTVPLENALNGVPGVDVMRSKSVPQLSSILLIFKPGADEIRARQQLVQFLHQFHLQAIGDLIRHVRVEGDHAHPEGMRARRHMPADASQPHQAECFSIEMYTHERQALPLFLAQQRVGLRNVAAQRQHQREGHLGRSHGVDFRDVHDHHPGPGSCLDIDVLQPNPGACRDF